VWFGLLEARFEDDEWLFDQHIVLVVRVVTTRLCLRLCSCWSLSFDELKGWTALLTNVSIQTYLLCLDERLDI